MSPSRSSPMPFTSFAQNVTQIVPEKLAEGFAEIRSELHELRKEIEAKEMREGEERVADLVEVELSGELPTHLHSKKVEKQPVKDDEGCEFAKFVAGNGDLFESEVVVESVTERVHSVRGSRRKGYFNHQRWRTTQAESRRDVNGGCLRLEGEVRNPHMGSESGTGCGSGGGPGNLAFKLDELSVDCGTGGFDDGTTICGGWSGGTTGCAIYKSDPSGSEFGPGYLECGTTGLTGGGTSGGAEGWYLWCYQKKIPEDEGGICCVVFVGLEGKTKSEGARKGNPVKSNIKGSMVKDLQADVVE